MPGGGGIALPRLRADAAITGTISMLACSPKKNRSAISATWDDSCISTTEGVSHVWMPCEMSYTKLRFTS
jgi:hypothetical protein